MEMCKSMAVVVTIIVLYSIEAMAEGGDPQITGCIQKLIPCQPYLHTVDPHPPASCCGPMKEIVEKDAPCLCAVFNNPNMLKTLNLTKENALILPKACGANPDVSLCSKNASASLPPTPTPPSSQPAKGGASVSTVSFIGFMLSAFVTIILY